MDELSDLLPWLVPFGLGLLVGHPLAATYAHWQREADPDRQDSPRERRWRVQAEALAVLVAVGAGIEAAHLSELSRTIGAFLGLAGGVGGRWAWPAIDSDVWPIVVGWLRRKLGGGANGQDPDGTA